MGRTNIVIDDELVGRVMDRYNLKTKTEAVDMALRHLAGQPMTREEMLAMHGANLIEDIPAYGIDPDRPGHDPD